MPEETKVNKEDSEGKNKENNTGGISIKDLEPSIQKTVKDMLAEARKDEKDKLYGRITKLEEIIDTLKQDSNDETLQKENKELQSQIETLNKQITDLTDKLGQKDEGKEDETKGKEDKTKGGEDAVKDEQIKELTKLITDLSARIESNEKSTKEQLEKAISGVEQKQSQKEIDAYREKAIAGLPETIAKSVPNTSIKDIDDAVKNLKEELTSLLGEALPKGSTSLLSSGKIPFTNPSMTDFSTSARQVQEMSMEEYAKFREENPALFNGGQRSGLAGGTLKHQ
jgi:DNA repair exonuclease SbcCD ATPase subunit